MFTFLLSAPAIPQNFVRTASTAYDLTLEWDELEYCDEFQVTYTPDHGHRMPLVIPASSDPTITLNDLMASTKYDVCVRCVSGQKSGEPACDCIFTSKYC